VRIFLVEGWYSGSHKAWADGFARNSAHEVHVLGLEGIHWRWRLQGGCVTAAEMIASASAEFGPPDLLVVSATLDAAALAGLARHVIAGVPVVVWFHENQLTYPPSSNRPRDPWPEWANWKSALVADRVVFNSEYHRREFLDALPRLLGRAPDYLHDERFLDVVSASSVLPVGVDIASSLAHERATRPVPLIVWNHRWDADKDPRAFVDSVIRLAEEGIEFEVALLGEDRHFVGDERARALRELGDRVIAAGHLPEDEYRELLTEAQIVVSTAQHEFFGVSVVEAVASGCLPVVPNRLSYPEILGEFSGRYAYRHGRPTSSIRLLLADRRLLDEGDVALRASTARFDWSVVAPAYDRFFAEVGAQPQP
jgi:glycosyltransferase involved in cell wall biosynthesis